MTTAWSLKFDVVSFGQLPRDGGYRVLGATTEESVPGARMTRSVKEEDDVTSVEAVFDASYRCLW